MKRGRRGRRRRRASSRPATRRRSRSPPGVEQLLRRGGAVGRHDPELVVLRVNATRSPRGRAPARHRRREASVRRPGSGRPRSEPSAARLEADWAGRVSSWRRGRRRGRNDPAAVAAHAEPGQLLAIVVVVPGELRRGVVRRVGGPDVPPALLIENPGDAGSGAARGERGRETDSSASDRARACRCAGRSRPGPGARRPLTRTGCRR